MKWNIRSSQVTIPYSFFFSVSTGDTGVTGVLGQGTVWERHHLTYGTTTHSGEGRSDNRPPPPSDD